MAFGWRRAKLRRGKITRRGLSFESIEARLMCDANPDDACDTVCSPDNGSGGSTGGGTVDSSTVLPDFSLPDVNPDSPLAGQQVSPREYIRQMSVWYFGHAT